MSQIGIYPDWGKIGAIHTDRASRIPCAYHLNRYRNYWPDSPVHCIGFVEWTLEQVETGDIVTCSVCRQKYKLKMSG